MRDKQSLGKRWIGLIVFVLAVTVLSSCGGTRLEPNLVTTVFCSSEEITIPTEECNALGALYNDTHGSNWNRNDGWFGDVNPCTWHGIDCYNDHVISIERGNMNLVGSLPVELGDLPYLQTLDLRGNELSGTIPFAALSRLSDLEILWLNNNNLSGTLCGVGNLSVDMDELFLHDNNLVGVIPPEIKNLLNVTKLNLSQNNFIGEIPKIDPFYFGSLEILNLGINSLTGSIPAEIGNYPNLQELTLGPNQLTGTIPPELSSLNRLRLLYLGVNSLEGRVPEALGNLTLLENLWLNNNNLVGAVPTSFSNMADMNQILYSGTGLCEPDIPVFQSWLSGVSSVSNTGIPTCDFDCSLQNFIPTGECDALQALYESTDGGSWTNNTGWFDYENPCDWEGIGCDPPEHVTTIDLHGHNLVGTIPPELGNLPELERLRLGDNSLSGHLPLSLQNLGELTHLEYDETGVCEPAAPSFQTWLFSNPNLNPDGTDLICDFSCATQESIPESECSGLVALYNSTSGDFWTDNYLWMEDIDPCKWKGVNCPDGHVETLNLFSNHLVGTIPPEIGNLTELRGLYLGDNFLSGSIPIELTQLSLLGDLYLNSFGGLTGNIPLEIGGMCSLRQLHLSNNSLSGPIPAELGNLYNLTELLLGSNDLTGNIPVELSRMNNLAFLFLGSNSLEGEIPRELGELTELSEIRLGNNHLSGTIPKELSNIDDLYVLDLSETDIVGNIPQELGDLIYLRTLDVNDTLLSGVLPDSLTNLSQLSMFYFDETDLCEPAAPTFHTWLDDVDNVQSSDVVCNTQSGTNFVVQPPDENNPGERPVTITFNNVTKEGHTTLKVTSIAPSPPYGFSIGDPTLYYLVETSAEYSQGYEICIQDDSFELIAGNAAIIHQYDPSQGNWIQLDDSSLHSTDWEACGIGSQIYSP